MVKGSERQSREKNKKRKEGWGPARWWRLRESHHGIAWKDWSDFYTLGAEMVWKDVEKNSAQCVIVGMCVYVCVCVLALELLAINGQRVFILEQHQLWVMVAHTHTHTYDYSVFFYMAAICAFISSCFFFVCVCVWVFWLRVSASGGWLRALRVRFWQVIG